MLPRFNIALLPTSIEINEAFYQAAKPLGALADGHWLAPGESLPHVTLCQFRAESEQAAIQAIKEFLGFKLSIRNTGIYLHQGTGVHAGKYWTGYITVREKTLMDLQERVFNALISRVPEVFEKPRDQYFPHVTMARLPSIPPHLDTAIFLPKVVHTDIDCIVKVGACHENGQFMRVIS